MYVLAIARQDVPDQPLGADCWLGVRKVAVLTPTYCRQHSNCSWLLSESLDIGALLCLASPPAGSGAKSKAARCSFPVGALSPLDLPSVPSGLLHSQLRLLV